MVAMTSRMVVVVHGCQQLVSGVHVPVHALTLRGSEKTGLNVVRAEAVWTHQVLEPALRVLVGGQLFLLVCVAHS